MMDFEIIRYRNLQEEREQVHSSYYSRWRECFEEEQGLAGSAEEQWERGDRLCPELQNALIVKADGKWKVAYSIMARETNVPGLPTFEEWIKEGMPKNYPDRIWRNSGYPKTWYEVEKSHDPYGNLCSNIAITDNPEFRFKGGSRHLINRQLEIIREKGKLGHTFTPKNNYKKALEEGKASDEEEYLFRAFTGEVDSPFGMHTKFFLETLKDLPVDELELLDLRRSRIPLIFYGGRKKLSAMDMCANVAYNGPGKEAAGWAARYMR